MPALRPISSRALRWRSMPLPVSASRVVFACCSVAALNTYGGSGARKQGSNRARGRSHWAPQAFRQTAWILSKRETHAQRQERDGQHLHNLYTHRTDKTNRRGGAMSARARLPNKQTIRITSKRHVSPGTRRLPCKTHSRRPQRPGRHCSTKTKTWGDQQTCDTFAQKPQSIEAQLFAHAHSHSHIHTVEDMQRAHGSAMRTQQICQDREGYLRMVSVRPCLNPAVDADSYVEGV
jgi:hypothetical protein